MPPLEQHKPSELSASNGSQSYSGFHHELNQIWGPCATKPEQIQNSNSNALEGFGQFIIGVGEGFGNFVNETAHAAVGAVSHPSETIHGVVEGTNGAIKSAKEAVGTNTSYIADKVSHGDVAGVAWDAAHTTESISRRVAQSVDHFNHLSAKEKGYIVGHDVAPVVVTTVVAPELIPEGAMAAACTKVAAAVGRLASEEGAIAKIATTLEKAISITSEASTRSAGKMIQTLETTEKGFGKIVQAPEVLTKSSRLEEISVKYDRLLSKMDEALTESRLRAGSGGDWTGEIMIRDPEQGMRYEMTRDEFVKFGCGRSVVRK